MVEKFGNSWLKVGRTGWDLALWRYFETHGLRGVGLGLLMVEIFCNSWFEEGETRHCEDILVYPSLGEERSD
jgi:hypothetical protein